MSSTPRKRSASVKCGQGVDELGVMIKLTGLSDSSSTAEMIVTSSSLRVSVPRSRWQTVEQLRKNKTRGPQTHGDAVPRTS